MQTANAVGRALSHHDEPRYLPRQMRIKETREIDWNVRHIIRATY